MKKAIVYLSIALALLFVFLYRNYNSDALKSTEDDVGEKAPTQLTMEKTYVRESEGEQISPVVESTVDVVDPEDDARINSNNESNENEESKKKKMTFSDIPVGQNPSGEVSTNSKFSDSLEYDTQIMKLIYSNELFTDSFRISKFNDVDIKYFVGLYQGGHRSNGVDITYKLMVEAGEDGVPQGCFGIHYDDGRKSQLFRSRDNWLWFFQTSDRHRLYITSGEYHLFLYRFYPKSTLGQEHALHLAKSSINGRMHFQGSIALFPYPSNGPRDGFCSNPEIVESN